MKKTVLTFEKLQVLQGQNWLFKGHESLENAIMFAS